MEKETHNHVDVSMSPDIELCTETHGVRVGQESLKRDLSSRHINMIAIAGMIVSD